MKKKTKTFDAVKMMRKIRDKISSETKNMSFEEFQNYIQLRLKKKSAKLVIQ